MEPVTVVAIGVAVYLLTREEAPPPPPPPPPVPKDRIVLLPEPGGKPSAVLMKSPQGSAVLDRPYAAADIGAKGSIDLGQSSAEEVSRRFGATLAAQPPRPVSWLVHFVSGKNELTADSRPVLDLVKGELARRPAPEVAVIGHTDRVGKIETNDALSLKRAQFVRDELVKSGIDVRQVEAFGRGEREPLVPTADEVAEPRNRRVEINVR